MSEADEERLERLALVRALLRAEALERLLERLSAAGRVGSFTPAGDGRVAVIGATLGLRAGDMIFGAARDLPAAVARGLSFERLLHQASGTAADPALGRGMPGALSDREAVISLSDGGPAACLVHAAGFGQAAQQRRDDRAALAFLGTATLDQGDVHAALSFASLRKARTIFVLRGRRPGAAPSVGPAADAWGLPVVEVHGDDGWAIREAVVRARQRAVAGEGPTLVDARLQGPAEPLDFRALRDLGAWAAQARAELTAEIDTELERALDAADRAGMPASATLSEHVYGAAAGQGGTA